jgi:hypothetical protein
LGNNVDHVGLRVANPREASTAPQPQNHVDDLDGQLITLAQVMVEEIVVSFECDNDEKGDEHLWSDSKGEFLFWLAHNFL